MKTLLAYVIAVCNCHLFCAAFAVEIKLDEHTFQLPEGFAIERVAGPPLVDRPISADFDEEGRLYVTDSSGSNAPLPEQLKNPTHRVVRLEDTDGDGAFDKSVVFADKMMFPEGAMWYDGSLYVAAPPSIWKLTDTDGDGRADERIEWYQGKTLTGCGNDLHGPYLGPDGWIYWAKGAWAEQTFDRPGSQPLVTKAAHLFRCRADEPIDPQTGSIETSGIEPVMVGGMDNPVEVAFMPGGERMFTSTFIVHPGGGQRDGLLHAIYGGVYGKSKEEVFVGHPRTGELMPVMRHFGAAAPSGLTRFESDAFGVEYQDNLYACLFNMRKITRHALSLADASFVSEDEDFLVSDHVDFHPTDVLEAADGSLIVVNTGGWYKLCCPTSQLEKPDIKGAIYRVKKANSSLVVDPWGRELNWAEAEVADLAERLGDARPAVRRRAVHNLAKRGPDAVGVLQSIADPTVTNREVARLNAVWAMTRIDSAAARQAVQKSLGDPDETVRQAAIHAVSLWREKEAVSGLLELLKTTSAHNRRAAAEALGRIGDSRAVAGLLAAAERADDRVGQHSITFALIEIGDAGQTRLGLEASNANVRRVAMIALDQMSDGGLRPIEIVPLLTRREESEPKLRETADWIVARHPEWGAALVDYFEEALLGLGVAGADADSDAAAQSREDLRRRLLQFVEDSDILELLVGVLRSSDYSADAKRIVLQVMGDSGNEILPMDWLVELERLVRSDEIALTREAVAVLRKVPAKGSGVKALTVALVALGHNEDAPEDLRLAALAAVPGGLREVDEGLLGLLGENLDSEQPVSSRAAAVDVLVKAVLTNGQLIELTETLASVSPLDIEGLLKAFERSQDETLGAALVAALAASPARSALREESLKPLMAKFPATVAEKAERLYEVLRTDRAEQHAHLEHLLATLPEGDIRRGQLVFKSAKAACSSCHEIGYLGGNVGPDLTHIAKIRSARDLLEAVVFPSASLVRSYEPSTVVTADGVVLNGLIREQTEEGILLATGPDKEVRLAHDEIEEILPSSVSVMPAGLDKQLTLQQLADVMAFLQSRN